MADSPLVEERIRTYVADHGGTVDDPGGRLDTEKLAAAVGAGSAHHLRIVLGQLEHEGVITRVMQGPRTRRITLTNGGAAALAPAGNATPAALAAPAPSAEAVSAPRGQRTSAAAAPATAATPAPSPAPPPADDPAPVARALTIREAIALQAKTTGTARRHDRDRAGGTDRGRRGSRPEPTTAMAPGPAQDGACTDAGRPEPSATAIATAQAPASSAGRGPSADTGPRTGHGRWRQAPCGPGLGPFGPSSGRPTLANRSAPDPSRGHRPQGDATGAARRGGGTQRSGGTGPTSGTQRSGGPGDDHGHGHDHGRRDSRLDPGAAMSRRPRRHPLLLQWLHSPAAVAPTIRRPT